MTNALRIAISGPLLAAAVGAIGCAAFISADAQASPNADIETIVRDDGVVEVRNADNGALIVRADPARLYTPHRNRNRDQPATSIDVEPRPGGFDIRFEFTNDQSTPRLLGVMYPGDLLLGEDVIRQKIDGLGQDIEISASEFERPRGMAYPGKLYSPVMVLRNQQYAVGFGLMYPMLDYEHDVRLDLDVRDPQAGEPADAWTGGWRLSNLGGERGIDRVSRPVELAPGESKAYTVFVRVTPHVDEWIRTLVPYRDYFRSEIGEVRYQRDPRPVRGVTISGGWATSSSNPFGFVPEDRRPDLHGWEPWRAKLERTKNNGADRIMLWAPSGVYRHNQERNYPFQFTSNWMRGSGVNNQMDNAPEKLSRLAEPGFELGLWWGRAVQIADRWDTSEYERMDIDNPQHRQLAFEELDLAAQAGATRIGLDAFVPYWMPGWDLHEWLLDMEQRYPDMQFVTEGLSNDYLHAFAPTSTSAFARPNAAPDDPSERSVSVPFYLADFLLPGHETWIFFNIRHLEQRLGRQLTEQEKEAELVRIAELGYVPVVFHSTIFDAAPDAAASWQWTVPADLQSGGRSGDASEDDDSGPQSGADSSHVSRTTPGSTRGQKTRSQSSRLSSQPPVVQRNGGLLIRSKGRTILVPPDARIVKTFQPRRDDPSDSEESGESEDQPRDRADDEDR